MILPTKIGMTLMGAVVAVFIALSDAAQLAFITAIAPTVASIGAMVAAIFGAIRSSDNGKKSDALITKTTEIHTLTNSNLANVTNKLDTAMEKILGLERIITEQNKTQVQDVQVVNDESHKVPVKQGTTKK